MISIGRHFFSVSTGSRRHALAAAFLVAAALTGGGPAAAQQLIVAPALDRIQAAPLVIDRTAGLRRHRVVTIDPAVLANHVAPEAAGGDRAAAARAVDGLVQLEMFPGVAGLFQRNHVTVADDGALEWDGGMIGGHPGVASLRVKGTRVYGQVQIGQRTFRIEPLGPDHHVVKEYDTESLPGDIVIPVPGQRGATMPGPDAIGRSTVTTTIDVLVAYTARARDASTMGIGQEIKLAIQLANTAYRNSRARVQLRLVRRMLARGYDEDARSYVQNLYDLTSGAVLASVRTERDAYGADLVALIREAGAYCGVGWMPTPPTAGTSGYGFSVTSRGCITNHTFAHELGHNMGLNHDRYVVSNPPAGSYNYGYANTVARVRTIMAYNNSCSALGFNCARIPFFSTPNVLYNGSIAIGLPTTNPQAAFAVRSLNENRFAVAGYRTPPPADRVAMER